MRTMVVLVPTRNQSWNVRSVARLVTSKGNCRSGKKNNANAGGSGKGLMQFDVWIDLVPQLMFVKDRASLRLKTGWRQDLYFSWVMISFSLYGKGIVALEFSSGKTSTFFNVLYVPKLRNYVE
ncbi:hypothetical protein Tco_1073212 [Tanacetum coccineum]